MPRPMNDTNNLILFLRIQGPSTELRAVSVSNGFQGPRNLEKYRIMNREQKNFEEKTSIFDISCSTFCVSK
jgi:hypothetical protein